MSYKVYSGPAGAEALAPFATDHLLFKQFASFDDALSWAGHLRGTGRVALLIEDDAGHLFDRRAIAAALSQTRMVRGGASH